MEQELGATLEEFKKYILEGKYRILPRDVNLYIKISSYIDKNVIVISFHESL